VVGSNSGTVQNCSVSGSVEGNYYSGGVVGYNSDEGIVENCYAAANVKDNYYAAGGIVGINGGVV